MNEARQILESIISDFSAEKFSRFFREKSRGFKESGEREKNYSRYNDDDFGGGLNLGEISFSDGDSLLICVFEVKKELSERSGKKAQYDKAKAILKAAENQKYSAGIFIFCDASGNFRFSLVYPESIGVKRQWNNFRRFTYFVSGEFTNKTFLKQIGEGDFADLAKIKDVFSVEKVTKEFFDNYKKLFERLLDHLKNDNAFKAFSGKHGLKLEIFAKKLLGQIVFIYFLQKKRWLGAKKGERISDGDDRFLRNLFEKCKQENKSFFNDYLEYLFYDCLNKVPERAGSFYREKFNCQIPFLNGGLFEPINDYSWKDEYIHIPDEIFSNKNGSGILDIFDIYNFTIDENTPEDQEVSVDPEMLGKVFENLLEDNIRKGQGAFYTPREIVYYMCRESLINYLASEHSNLSEEKIRQYIETANSLHKNDTEEFRRNWRGESFTPGQWKELDDLLANIKVCDPACGSGAFLVGMLNEIVKLRIFLQFTPDSELFSKSSDAIKELSEYYLKKETIQNCLYGVDIDPGAVDIAKLRFWLSIVVEEDIDDIEPLPNLDYKIMQGNSLLEDLVIGGSVIKFKFDGSRKMDGRTKEQKALFETGKTMRKLFLEESDTLAEMLEKYHTEYFSITDPDKKKILKKKIDEIEDDLINSKCLEEIRNAQSAIKNNPNNEKERLKNLEKELAIKKVLNKWKTDHLRPFFPWRLHFGEVFGRENGGFDVVIGNPPYLQIPRGIINTENFPFSEGKDKGKQNLYKAFIELSFNLLRDFGNSCLITQSSLLCDISAQYTRELLLTKTIIYKIIEFPKKSDDPKEQVFEAVLQGTCICNFFKQDPKNEIFFNISTGNNVGSIKKLLFEKIKQSEIIKIYPDGYFIPLIMRGEFNILKKISNISESFENLIEQNLKGDFNLGIEKDKITKEITKTKIYRGKNIHRYFFNKKSEEYICDNFKIESQKLNRERQYLVSQNITGTTDEYRLHFVLTDLGEQYLFGDTVNKILLKDESQIKFILGILNSKLMDWYFRKTSTNNHVNGYEIAKFPIVKNYDYSKRQKISDIVSGILKLKKSEDFPINPEKQEKARELEREIDELVYKLYGLTEEEMGIVEA